ncbi:ABC transporter permease subunit [Herbiconiux sp. CPCC 205716]|uniref:ABC transporter permease subunit n=1 Tax=Herbiconiux gentiana TaxID=2970912 RepID=A0ABT2GD58_9MICO|nr:ABC transporter permease subunit [Herbiconiux gentiana]MCS5714160.1 ABC transporter permease subunit [Herbiconiux gentiana]
MALLEIGGDVAEETSEVVTPLERSTRIDTRRLVGPLATLTVVVLLMVAWEIAARTVLAQSYVFPAPSAIAGQMADDAELLLVNSAATARTAAIGFLVGQAMAILLAVALSFSVAAELVVTKLALVVYSLPTLAIAPILGTMFGLEGTRVAVVAIVVFFPTLLATVSGLSAAGENPYLLVRSLGGTRWTVLTKISFRTALPEIFAGLKLGVPGAVLGAIASEWLGASEGLGIFMVNALAYLQPARVWATCVVIVFGTILVYGVIALLDRVCNGWAIDARGDR